jgi:monosaccharide-transporting ATPase
VLLTLRQICKSFPGLRALDQVDLTLRAGEIHALMGENGAGKSTLIKTLTGVYTADSGSIHLAGQPIHPKSTRDAEAAGISTVYQEVNLIPTLSIVDNILLGRQPTRLGLLRKSAMAARARAALDRLGLELDPHRPLASLSIAEQQLVAIARALDIDAKILILDEPTSSLDEREVQRLFQILRRLRDQGLALLFVTHFLDQVYAISGRITVLRNGKLVGEYPVADLPRLKLISAMLGREFEELKKVEEKVHGTTSSASRVSSSPEATSSHESSPQISDRQSSIINHQSEQTTPFLTAQALGKKNYLTPLDLTIHPGQTLGLAGLLGSGRTETAKLLFAAIAPDPAAQLTIRGQPTRLRNPRDAVRAGLAFTSEDRKTEGICPRLSVRENMTLAMQASRGAARQLSRAEQNQIADHYIKALNIKTPTPETPISNLSGGNQQKVLLARWLCMSPQLLILDEPTRGIDIGAKAEIEKLVETLREKGMSVLFISSELDELLRVSQRVIILRDRQKIAELEGHITEQQVLETIAKTT